MDLRSETPIQASCWSRFVSYTIIIKPGERKPSPTLCQFFPLFSPGGSTNIPRSFALSGSGAESFNPILDPDADPDHQQNLTTSALSWVKFDLP